MMDAGYKMRVSVYDTGKGSLMQVRFLNGVRELFKSPVVEIKRVNDRLAFLPKDGIVQGKGYSSVSDTRIQSANTEVCKKVRDFVGEYDVVNVTDSGVVFIKLSDRHELTNTLPTQKGRVRTSCSRPRRLNGEVAVCTDTKEPAHTDSVSAPQDLGAMLQDRVGALKSEIDELQKLLEDLERQADDVRATLKEKMSAIVVFGDALNLERERGVSK